MFIKSEPISLIKRHCQWGVSLIELVIFISIVGVAGTMLMKVYSYSVLHQVDPIEQVRAYEAAQSKLDEVLALKYDENTPTGDIPACNSVNPVGLACTNTKDANMNDIDDYHNEPDYPYHPNLGYLRTVRVTTGVNEKLISVEVTTPRGQVITLAAYRANF